MLFISFMPGGGNKRLNWYKMYIIQLEQFNILYIIKVHFKTCWLRLGHHNDIYNERGEEGQPQ